MRLALHDFPCRLPATRNTRSLKLGNNPTPLGEVALRVSLLWRLLRPSWVRATHGHLPSVPEAISLPRSAAVSSFLRFGRVHVTSSSLQLRKLRLEEALPRSCSV